MEASHSFSKGSAMQTIDQYVTPRAHISTVEENTSGGTSACKSSTAMKPAYPRPEVVGVWRGSSLGKKNVVVKEAEEGKLTVPPIGVPPTK